MCAFLSLLLSSCLTFEMHHAAGEPVRRGPVRVQSSFFAPTLSVAPNIDTFIVRVQIEERTFSMSDYLASISGLEDQIQTFKAAQSAGVAKESAR